jgi:hypothetical protein
MPKTHPMTKFLYYGRCSGPTESKESEDIPRNSQHNSINILYTNAQSIVNKIDELRSVAFNIKPDIILINESWTNKDITNAYLNSQGYELSARKDRVDTTAGGRGGGLLVYSRCGLVITEKQLSSTFNQIISVSVETQTKPLLINLVYRSPNSSTENNVNSMNSSNSQHLLL